jgi:hypothetical protein
MDGSEEFLGLVKDGRFFRLGSKHAPGVPTNLTTIGMQEARPPETGQLDLSEYEGSAVMVRGHDGGGWIYSAAVIDQAGPILTAVVRHVFGTEEEG